MLRQSHARREGEDGPSPIRATILNISLPFETVGDDWSPDRLRASSKRAHDRQEAV